MNLDDVRDEIAIVRTNMTPSKLRSRYSDALLHGIGRIFTCEDARKGG